jgi:hypothetical protein
MFHSRIAGLVDVLEAMVRMLEVGIDKLFGDEFSTEHDKYWNANRQEISGASRDRVMRLYVAVSLFVVIEVMKCPALVTV